MVGPMLVSDPSPVSILPGLRTAQWFKNIANQWGYPCNIFVMQECAVIVPRDEDDMPAFFLGLLDQHADGDRFYSVWGAWGRHDLALFIYPVEG